MQKRFIAPIILFLLMSNSYAQFFSYEEPPMGWFWYREMKENIEEGLQEIKERDKMPMKDIGITKKEDKKEEKSEADSGDSKYLKHPKWGQLPVVSDAPDSMKKLLYNPTLVNAKEYLKWQWDVIERASIVADLLQRAYVEEGGSLYPDNSPKNQLASYASQIEKKNRESVLLDKATKHVGLFYFYKPGCTACDVQYIVIQKLLGLGFTIVGIYQEGEGSPEIGITSRLDSGASGYFGVSEVPSLVAVSDKTKNFRIISRGVTTLDVILERIFKYTNEEVYDAKERS